MKTKTVDELLADVRHAYPDEARRLASLAQEVTMRDLEILLLRRKLSEVAPRSVRKPAPYQVRDQHRGGDDAGGERAIGGGIVADPGELAPG